MGIDVGQEGVRGAPVIFNYVGGFAARDERFGTVAQKDIVADDGLACGGGRLFGDEDGSRLLAIDDCIVNDIEVGVGAGNTSVRYNFAAGGAGAVLDDIADDVCPATIADVQFVAACALFGYQQVVPDIAGQGAGYDQVSTDAVMGVAVLHDEWLGVIDEYIVAGKRRDRVLVAVLAELAVLDKDGAGRNAIDMNTALVVMNIAVADREIGARKADARGIGPGSKAADGVDKLQVLNGEVVASCGIYPKDTFIRNGGSAPIKDRARGPDASKRQVGLFDADEGIILNVCP